MQDECTKSISDVARAATQRRVGPAGTRVPISRKIEGTVKRGWSPRKGRRFEFLPRREPCDERTLLSVRRLSIVLAIAGAFTPVLAKHPKSFSLKACVSVGVDRMQRNFEPMRKQVEAWQREGTHRCTTKVETSEAFVEGTLEVQTNLPGLRPGDP